MLVVNKKKIKLGKGTGNRKGSITILDKGVREDIEKVMFEWRLKGGEGGTQRYLEDPSEF